MNKELKKLYIRGCRPNVELKILVNRKGDSSTRILVDEKYDMKNAWSWERLITLEPIGKYGR